MILYGFWIAARWKKKRGQVMQSSFTTYYSEKVYYNTMYSTEHRDGNDEIYDYDIFKSQQT